MENLQQNIQQISKILSILDNNEYKDTIILFLILRRLDCAFKGVYSLKNCQHNSVEHFNSYIKKFNEPIYKIIENFQINKLISKLVKNNLLSALIDEFTKIDLHPNKVSNHEIGSIFEDMLRQSSNEKIYKKSGEYYTPREVIRLMVNIVFAEHKDELQKTGLTKSIFDPACGTGGMLTVAKEYIKKEINPDVDIEIYGQELNAETSALAALDMLITNGKTDSIKNGNSLTNDLFKDYHFDYMLSNPPFGVSWKDAKSFIVNEAKDPHGRFRVGLPKVSDGALLFLQHMISKMNPNGSKIAIVFNGSPLFTGDAGSGENNIRKWIIENDWLEAIIALPVNMFINTPIATYIWVVSNNKLEKRKGKVQLINAVEMFQKMEKNLGNKRYYISGDQIKEITEIYTRFEKGENCKIFDNEYLGYTKITVERPLKENGKIVRGSKGRVMPDTSLRDYEKVPLTDDIDAYFEREVKPHVPDAWMDRSKDKVGYEISFTRYFYKYKPLRPSEEIKEDILKLESEIQELFNEIFEL